MLRRLYADQPDSFAFTPANRTWAEAQVTKYPEGRQASAVIPLLWRAQEQEGWLTRPAIETIADMLGMAYIRVLEVASFYFMFQLQPVGSLAHIQICGTTSCMICGAEDLMAVCQEKIAAKPHELSADGKFSWEEVECLGACANAPMAQIGKDYYEDLTTERLAEIIDEIAAGKVPVPGPQNGRYTSEPKSGLTSLTEHEEGRHQYNASAQIATDIGDTIKRIDGTEVPMTAPWQQGANHGDAPARVTTAEIDEPHPSENAPIDETGIDKREAQAVETGRPVSDRNPATDGSEAVEDTAQAEPGTKGEDASAPEGTRPTTLDGARDGNPDDLKQIKGIGPKLEEMLNGMGIYHFDQIAAWSDDEIAWVDQNLEGFKGRVTRDEWVEQAGKLAEGGGGQTSGETEKGDTN